MSKLKVYCAGPITGLTGQEVFEHYDDVSARLKDAGFQVFHPMIGKDHMRTEESFKSTGHNENPITKDRSIYGRDKWMVSQADIVFTDFTRATKASIGCCFELAWANLLGKQTVVVIPDMTTNPHNHAFIKEASDIIFSNTDEAIEYLNMLSTNVLFNN